MGKYELAYNICSLQKRDKQYQFSLTFFASEEVQLPEVTADKLVQLCVSLDFTGEVCIEKQLSVSDKRIDGNESVFLVNPDGSYEMELGGAK